jgi:hypothetical protein
MPLNSYILDMEGTMRTLTDADQAQWTLARFGDAPAEGPGSARIAGLTWGQRALWMAIQQRGSSQFLISLRRVIDMPRRAPADVPSVTAAIGALIERHSSLRTRPSFTGTAQRQLVSGHGEQPVLLVAADRAASAQELSALTEATARQLAATAFDHADEWPQRVALVHVDGQVRKVVVVFSHTTVDFQAAEIVMRDLRLLLLRGSIAAPAGPQSADIARTEQDVDHRRSTRAIAYWLDSYRRLPADTLPVTAPAQTPRFWRAILPSGAADTATRLLAATHHVSTATVWTAAVAAVFAAWGGAEICGVYTMTSNRSRDGHREAISKLNQLGLAVIDLSARPGFAELLPQVSRASLDAYRHAYYDPAELQHAFDAAGHPYAGILNPHCYFNDVRLATDADLFTHATGEAEVRQAMARSVIEWAERFDEFTWRVRVEIIDTPGGAGIALTADTTYLPPDAMKLFLRDIERLLVDAAFGDVPWPWRSRPAPTVPARPS